MKPAPVDRDLSEQLRGLDLRTRLSPPELKHRGARGCAMPPAAVLRP